LTTPPLVRIPPAWIGMLSFCHCLRSAFSYARSIGTSACKSSRDQWVTPPFSSLQPGDPLQPEYFGREYLPTQIQTRLGKRGLAYCNILRRIYASEDMFDRYKSYEGILRRNFVSNAKARACKKAVPFDARAMQQMAFGVLPEHFDGTTYMTPGRHTSKGRHMWALTVDRVMSSKGYVRGNIRFLPF